MDRIVNMRKLLNSSCCQLITTRSKFRIKPKQKKTRTVADSDRALEYFDLQYRNVLGELWPSVRIALLTQKKTCAIMNNFCDTGTLYTELLNRGAVDILENAGLKQKKLHKNERRMPEQNVFERVVKHTVGDRNVETTTEDGASFDNPEDYYKDMDRKNLEIFVPAKRIYSEFEENKMRDVKQSVFTPRDVKVDIAKAKKLDVSMDLHALAFPAGNVDMFPEPKVDRPNGHLCYFMMDAASILPVLALDLEEGDSVLDLCAAPGGKSLCIKQTDRPESIRCNDKSNSRLRRLRNIMNYYLPKENQNNITVTQCDGQLCAEPKFNKVLVDVPCNTDRNVVLVDDNNLFNPQRFNDRVELPNLQKNLILAGIKSCKPGGSVVYSTCTISPVQNDGVIQDTLDRIWKETDIDVLVEDLGEFAQIFSDTFKFHDNCRFGQLVVPSLSQNFGPMYFCKLRRVA